MTLNIVTDVDDTAWVDLHTAVGASPGDTLIIEDRGPIINKLHMINSVASPVGEIEDVGGVRAQDLGERFTSTPGALESTWARRTQGGGDVSVQS